MHKVDVLVSMTVSEFRSFKKAMQVLCRAGMSSDEASNILLDRFQVNRNNRMEFEARRRQERYSA